MSTTEIQILVLLLIATLVAVLARRLRFPYTVALVVAGVGVGWLGLPVLQGLRLTPELLFLLLLPPLLFEAAFHVQLRSLRRNMAPIGLLAVAGVPLAAGLTATVAWGTFNLTGTVHHFGWGPALVFGTLLAATDPVSVLGLFRKLGVPDRLYLIVEGESLLNDGVAVVLFTITTGVLGFAVGHGAVFEVHAPAAIAAAGVRTFMWMAGIGVLLGGMIGAAASVATRRLDDHLVEVTLTTLVAYGSFLTAEMMQASGVLSVVTAGIVTGSFGSRFGMSPTTRMAVESFWEYAAFLANSFIFLLVGLQLSPGMLLHHGGAIAIAFLAVLVGRLASIYMLLPIAGKLGERVPRDWWPVLVWGGLRGSLSMVLVASLPEGFPARQTMIYLVFGVVAASLVLQGLTMPPLLRLLKLATPGGPPAELGIALGHRIAAEEALAEIESFGRRWALDPESAATLRAYYESMREDAARAARACFAGRPELRREREREIARHLVLVEKDALREAYHEGLLGIKATGHLLAEVDARLSSLDHEPARVRISPTTLDPTNTSSGAS